MKKSLSLLVAVLMLASCAQKPAQKGEAASPPASLYSVASPGKSDSYVRIPGGNVYTLNKYQPSERNIASLKEAKNEGLALRPIVFHHPKNENNMLTCRGLHLIYGPNKKPFSYLVESAMNEELDASGLKGVKRYRARATLDEMSFSTLDYKLFGTGKWVMRATLTSWGHEPLVIQHEYAFPLAIMSEKTCANAVESMVPAIQSFLNAMYTNPRFGEFMHYRPCTDCTRQTSTHYITRKKNQP